MVSTHPPTSKSSSPFSNPLVTVPKAPITIGIIVTFMFHSFFQFPSKVQVLILLFTFFQFYSLVSRDSKVDNFANSLFFFLLLLSLLFCELTLGLIFWPQLSDPFVSQCKILYVLFWFLHRPFFKQEQILISCAVPSGSHFPTSHA